MWDCYFLIFDKHDEYSYVSIKCLSLFKAAWEPKPSRMLSLQLTDGTTVVQGMEYKPINSLSLSMKPGVKVNDVFISNIWFSVHL